LSIQEGRSAYLLKKQLLPYLPAKERAQFETE
jgi:hypothetical protein